jgi:hypothetical protein
MTPDERLAQIYRALADVGLESLVMGGHACRYYGVDRNTVDYDFFTGAESTLAVRERLARSDLLSGAIDGPSWRPDDFMRFEIGRLRDGREEWLEFWLRNHLLPDFAELASRPERGTYGGQEVAFIALSDLLRSKETEREGDWQDIALLEEVQDARNLSKGDLGTILRNLRSRRGFDRAQANGVFEDRSAVVAAAVTCTHPVTFAFLGPVAQDVAQPATLRMPIEAAYLAPLATVEFATAKHLALVEIIRRAYKRRAMEIDRIDKQSRLGKMEQ